MIKWIQRTIGRLAHALYRIFKPTMTAAQGGAVILGETPTQILTRKAVAVALGSLAVSMMTTPSIFAIDESLAMKVGDWLARIATNLWNYDGVATFS